MDLPPRHPTTLTRRQLTDPIQRRRELDRRDALLRGGPDVLRQRFHLFAVQRELPIGYWLGMRHAEPNTGPDEPAHARLCADQR